MSAPSGRSDKPTWIPVGSTGIMAVRADAIKKIWTEFKFHKHWVRLKLTNGDLHSVYPKFDAADEAAQREAQIRKVMP